MAISDEVLKQALAAVGGDTAQARTEQGEATFSEGKIAAIGGENLSDKGRATLDQVLAWQAQAQAQERGMGGRG